MLKTSNHDLSCTQACRKGSKLQSMFLVIQADASVYCQQLFLCQIEVLKQGKDKTCRESLASKKLLILKFSDLHTPSSTAKTTENITSKIAKEVQEITPSKTAFSKAELHKSKSL